MIFRWILQGCSRTTSSGRHGVAARRSGEAARVTGTAGRTPRAHARAPSPSFSPAAAQSTCCCLFLLASTGLSHRLIASVVGMTSRGATQQESATAAGNKTVLVPPPSSALRHLLESTIAREQLLPRPPGHASPQSGLDRVQGGQCDNVRAASCSEDLWTASPTRDRGGPGGLPPPRKVPGYPQKG